MLRYDMKEYQTISIDVFCPNYAGTRRHVLVYKDEEYAYFLPLAHYNSGGGIDDITYRGLLSFEYERYYFYLVALNTKNENARVRYCCFDNRTKDILTIKFIDFSHVEYQDYAISIDNVDWQKTIDISDFTKGVCGADEWTEYSIPKYFNIKEELTNKLIEMLERLSYKTDDRGLRKSF